MGNFAKKLNLGICVLPPVVRSPEEKLPLFSTFSDCDMIIIHIGTKKRVKDSVERGFSENTDFKKSYLECQIPNKINGQ